MSDFDTEHLQEIFTSFGEIQIRKMFGGKGIYHKGVIFAIIFEDGLRLRGDKQVHDDWGKKGVTPIVYIHKNTGKQTPMPYYKPPDSALEDPDEMAEWAREAYHAALRNLKPKKL